MQEKVSIMCSWWGWENPSLGLRAALRPRDGFSHPHQEHMKDTYNLTPHVRQVVCDDVTISRALLLYKIAFIFLSSSREQ